MKAGDLIFVYGTLRPGESNALSDPKRFPGMATHLGETRINGRLYDLGWYPGVKIPDEVQGDDFRETEDTVTGNVFKIDVLCLPNMLDSYEGYPHLYDRTEVFTEHGHVAWVYTYNGDVGENSRILLGDWKKK